MKAIILIYLPAALLRYFLSNGAIGKWCEDRPEFVNPFTSFRRVTESLFLHERGLSPYDGDIFHETPLMLRFLKWSFGCFRGNVHILFIAADLFTGYLVYSIGCMLLANLLKIQKRDLKEYSVNSFNILLMRLGGRPFWVLMIWLFNPYGIGTCLAKSTTVFHNLILAAGILHTLKGNKLAASLLMALLAYEEFYPAMLIVPVSMYFVQKEDETKKTYQRADYEKMITTIGIFAACVVGLLVLSYQFENSWKFLSGTYLFILNVPDLTPNVGLFWYFFTEMFDHFRLFFICVFQINAFIYLVPLSMKLRNDPAFLLYILMALTAIFKSYPSYGDSAVYLALLPVWSHLLTYVRNGLIIAAMFFVVTLLMPVMWHLWIISGSANANFYFAATLAYSLAQILLVTDLLYGYLRREFDLRNSEKDRMVDGKPIPVELQ